MIVPFGLMEIRRFVGREIIDCQRSIVSVFSNSVSVRFFREFNRHKIMKYYLNTNLDYQNGNKVHTQECYWAPALENQVSLGEHPNLFEAITFAKKKGYLKANSCFWCSREATIASNERQKTKTQLKNEIEILQAFIKHLNAALSEHLPSNVDSNLKSIIVEDFKEISLDLSRRGEIRSIANSIYQDVFDFLSCTLTEEPLMATK